MPATAESTWFTAARTAISGGSIRPNCRGRAPIDVAVVGPYGPPPRPQMTAHLSIPGPVSMPLTDLVAPNAIIPALKVTSKKQAIQELAAKAAKLTGQNERNI